MTTAQTTAFYFMQQPVEKESRPRRAHVDHSYQAAKCIEFPDDESSLDDTSESRSFSSEHKENVSVPFF